ncbi:glucokinase [Tropicimonas sp. S265A]|uniref:glucokinase n=1 Tax=Tropicimonas sp. S265A TaxID=3415134 RepID=UPI003C7AFB48
MAHPQTAPVLVADIGGTNTRVALADGTMVRAETVTKFRNAEYPSLDKVLRTYLERVGGTVSGACVALAGPTRDGVGSLTNLDWRMDEALLRDATGAAHVALLNDLVAQGYALGDIAPGALTPVIARPAPARTETCLMIGIGTGFNAAAVLHTPGGRHVCPSEAGHANLPVRTERELRLCRFVETAHGFPAVEDVLSGRGIERVHAFLAADPDRAVPPAAEIMARAAAGDRHALDTLELFIGLMGTVAGNLSLIHLPFGGVYLVGGVARAMGPYLEQMSFAEAFANKGRFAGFMRQFPVWLLEDDFAALTGCAAYLAQGAHHGAGSPTS